MTTANTEDNGVVVFKNKRILLVRRPNGLPEPEDFRLEQTDVVVQAKHLCPHRQNHRLANQQRSANANATTATTTTTTTTKIVLETLFLSIDPAMRGWMSAARSYLPPVQLGSVMRAFTISRVLAVVGESDAGADAGADYNEHSSSIEKDFRIGSIVRSMVVGVQSYFVLEVSSVSEAHKHLTRLDNITNMQMDNRNRSSSNKKIVRHRLSYASYLGVLGTTGLTAYFGLLRVGKPSRNDVVLVSGAAGATGSIVAQIAKHVVGCKMVIGTAGSDAKCEWLETNGIVDFAINYKTTKSLARAISGAVAKQTGTTSEKGKGGIDLVFDNVGSDFLEAALGNLAMGARIVLCGAISQYNANANANAASVSTITGPRNYMNLLVKRASMRGFVVLDYQNEYPTAISDLVAWIAEGKIKCYGEDMRYSGIENFVPALLSLFHGTNIGKVVLRAAETSTQTEHGLTIKNENGTTEGAAMRSKL